MFFAFFCAFSSVSKHIFPFDVSSLLYRVFWYRTREATRYNNARVPITRRTITSLTCGILLRISLIIISFLKKYFRISFKYFMDRIKIILCQVSSSFFFTNLQTGVVKNVRTTIWKRV
jgi:hypothetical protein